MSLPMDNRKFQPKTSKQFTFSKKKVLRVFLDIQDRLLKGNGLSLPCGIILKAMYESKI